MTLQSSGAISLSDVNVELGRSSTATICMNCSAVRTLFGVSSGSISMSSGYGKSNIPVGSSTYTAPGTYTFVVPQHTTRLSGLAISGGAAGGRPSHYIYPCFSGYHVATTGNNSGYVYGGAGGYGGGIAYRNNFSVTTGQSYTVYVASCAGGFNTSGSGSYVVSTSGSPSGYPVYSYPTTNSMQFFSGSTYGSTYAAGGRVGGSGSSAQASIVCQRGSDPWAGAGGGGGGVAGSACGPVTNYCSYNGFYTSCCFNYGAGGSTYGRACGSFYQFSGSCCSWRNGCSPHGGWPMYGRHGYGRSGGSAGGSAPSDPYARWLGLYCYYTGYRAGVGSGGGGGSNATYGFNNSGSFPSTGGVIQAGYGGGGGSGGGGGGCGYMCGFFPGSSYSGNGGSYGGGGGGASAALSYGNPGYGPNWSTSYYYGTCSSSSSFWNNRGIYAGVGAGGTVRLIYPGCTRSYPSTNVGCP